MAIHCRILAWEIPWTEEPGGLWSLVSQRVGHDWTHTDTHTHRHTHRHTGSFRSFMQDLVSWPEIEPRPCFLFFQIPLPIVSDGKVSACNVGDLGLIPGLGKSSGEGNGSPLQYSCLGISMDRGAWWATIHGVTKSRTRLSDFTFTSNCTIVVLYIKFIDVRSPTIQC